MSINVVIVAGNTTRDVEVRRTQSGMPVVSFGIAVNERRKNNHTGEWDDVPNYFDVSAFGERWEKIAPFMPKGTKLTVKGKLRYSQWERDGQKRSKVDIVAEDVELPPRPKQQNGYQGGTYQASNSMSGPEIEIDPIYQEDIPFGG